MPEKKSKIFLAWFIHSLYICFNKRGHGGNFKKFNYYDIIMNKIRRKQLDKIAAELEAIRERIEAIRDEEQDYFDNMPEAFQDGEKGERTQEAIDLMDDIFGNVDEAIENLNNLTNEY